MCHFAVLQTYLWELPCLSPSLTSRPSVARAAYHVGLTYRPPHPVSLPCRRPGSEKIRRGLTHIPGSPLEGLWVSWTKHRRLRVTPPVLVTPWAASVQGPLGSEVHGTW